MTALITDDAWFRMPPAGQEYRGPASIGAFFAAVSAGHRGQILRPVATGANGRPAFATFYLDPELGITQHAGLMVSGAGGARISDLTWFLGAGYLEPFDLAAPIS